MKPKMPTKLDLTAPKSADARDKPTYLFSAAARQKVTQRPLRSASNSHLVAVNEADSANPNSCKPAARVEFHTYNGWAGLVPEDQSK